MVYVGGGGHGFKSCGGVFGGELDWFVLVYLVRRVMVMGAGPQRGKGKGKGEREEEGEKYGRDVSPRLSRGQLLCRRLFGHSRDSGTRIDWRLFCRSSRFRVGQNLGWWRDMCSWDSGGRRAGWRQGGLVRGDSLVVLLRDRVGLRGRRQ